MWACEIASAMHEIRYGGRLVDWSTSVRDSISPEASLVSSIPRSSASPVAGNIRVRPSAINHLILMNVDNSCTFLFDGVVHQSCSKTSGNPMPTLTCCGTFRQARSRMSLADCTASASLPLRTALSMPIWLVTAVHKSLPTRVRT